MEQQSANMSMARSAFDLTRALLDTVEKGSSITKAVGGILQWLAREGINNTEYVYCMERAANITFPNDKGLQLRQKVLDSESRLQKVAGLKLVVSGAVGRSLALDPAYCYMVSTVAAIMVHNDYQYAVDALCEMILDRGEHQAGVHYAYSVHRIRLKPVLSKIVESIALNVVNAGHDLGGLPPDLAALCPHTTEPPTFAAVVMAVQRHDGDSLIYCVRFQAEILMWLMSHYEGTIEVSIAGNIVFEKQMGSSKRKVVMLVRERCSPEIECRTLQTEIKVSLNMGGKLSAAVSGTSSCCLGRPVPTTRQPLYSINVDKNRPRGVLSHIESTDVHLIAQAMVDWLLKLPLRPSFMYFGFDTVLTDSNPPQFAIGGILKQWPSLTHLYYGKKPKALSIYKRPSEDWDDAADRSMNGEHYRRGAWVNLQCVIEYFPAAMDLFERIGIRCSCDKCRNNMRLVIGKSGCLRATAAAELVVLLAHAISDGFGAQDASGLVEVHRLEILVATLFRDLIIDGLVRWDVWFSVAAYVHLGGNSWLNPTLGGSQDCTAFAAFQVGNSVVVAPWLDLTAKLSQSDSFGFEAAEGQLQGVHSEFAVVQTEAKMESAEALRKNTNTSNRTLDNLAVDVSDAFLETAIIGADPNIGAYRLLTMVKSDSFRRIVDPVDAIIGLYRSFFPQCNHPPRNNSRIFDSESVRVSTFDDILGHWDIENEMEGPSTYITSALDTLKFNVTMSLTALGCVVRDSNCCLPCALKEVGKHPSEFGRRVVNRSSDYYLTVRC